MVLNWINKIKFEQFWKLFNSNWNWNLKFINFYNFKNKYINHMLFRLNPLVVFAALVSTSTAYPTRLFWQPVTKHLIWTNLLRHHHKHCLKKKKMTRVEYWLREEEREVDLKKDIKRKKVKNPLLIVLQQVMMLMCSLVRLRKGIIQIIYYKTYIEAGSIGISTFDSDLK